MRSTLNASLALRNPCRITSQYDQSGTRALYIIDTVQPLHGGSLFSLLTPIALRTFLIRIDFN